MGAYFWESDPQRAQEWADWKVGRWRYEQAFVLGAIVDLRNCLDLIARGGLELLRDAYDSFSVMRTTAKLPIPENKSVPSDPNADRVLRFLDCAVIKHLHNILDEQAGQDDATEPFDTVRGMFAEGSELYPGSGFRERTHVQTAVRNSACIRGFFIPRL